MRYEPPPTKAEIFTQHHRYCGMVMTRGYRLSDAMNDPSTELVEIRDAQISQPTNPQLRPLESPQLMLKKDAIVLAMPTGSYEAPARRIYSFVEKQRYVAQVVVPGYTMVGTIHLPSRANPWVLMSESGPTPSFVPITDATVRFAGADVEPLHSKVIIFRRQFIESLFVSERPLSPQSLLEIARELRNPDAAELAKQLSEDLQSERDGADDGADEETMAIPLRLTPALELPRRA